MNFRNKPELHERLAAEYALGTLRGPARARLRRWMREDAALARAVGEWEARLAPMAEAVQPARPPARVWREIEARIGTAPARAEGFFGRAFAFLAAGAAAAVLFMAVIVPLLWPAAPGGEYVAVLSDPKTQQPVLLVSVGRQDRAMKVKTLNPAIQVPEKSLELWAVSKDGKPKSLGLVPGAPRGVIQLAALADQTLADVPLLAVSLEPPGGSTTGAPTGPVLYAGPCVKDW